jgi:WD40 repeat protein
MARFSSTSARSPNRKLMVGCIALTALLALVITAVVWLYSSGQPQSTLRVASTSEEPALVQCVGFSPDGQTLAAGSYSYDYQKSAGVGRLTLWDTASRQQRAAWVAHTGFVLSLTFSADGALLATASADGSVKLWDATTGGLRAILEGHTTIVSKVVFAADGKSLLSSGLKAEDGETHREFKRWDLTRGEELPLGDVPASLTYLAASADGAMAARAVAERTIALFDLPSGRQRRALPPHSSPVNCAAFSPDGQLLATGTGDITKSGPHPLPWRNGDVQVWSISTGRCLARFDRHWWGPIMGVAFSPDGKTLASASYDGTVKLRDLGAL